MISSIMAMYIDLNTPTKENNLNINSNIQIQKNIQENTVDKTYGLKLFKTGYHQTKQINTLLSAYKKSLDKLYGYLSLENDWDGYGGKAPSKNIIETGDKILEKLQSYAIGSPNVMISGSGEIGFFWEKGERYAEITCDSPSKYSFVYLNGRDSYYEENVNFEKFSFDLIQKISAINKIS